LYGFGTFMSGQVIADLKFGSVLRNVPDWKTFAISGPGSVRGLTRIYGLPLAVKWRGGEDDWHNKLLEVRKVITPSLPKALRGLDAQNVEHGLCELDKWCRVQEGGRPKQTFVRSNEVYR
jgi:hypothetical protein